MVVFSPFAVAVVDLNAVLFRYGLNAAHVAKEVRGTKRLGMHHHKLFT